MVYQSDSIWTRQERILSIPTGSVTSKVTTADTLHSNMAVMCCSKALELNTQQQTEQHKIKQQKNTTEFFLSQMCHSNTYLSELATEQHISNIKHEESNITAKIVKTNAINKAN